MVQGQGSSPTPSLKDLRAAVTGAVAAFRCITDYEPAGGDGRQGFPADL